MNLQYWLKQQAVIPWGSVGACALISQVSDATLHKKLNYIKTTSLSIQETFL